MMMRISLALVLSTLGCGPSAPPDSGSELDSPSRSTAKALADSLAQLLRTAPITAACPATASPSDVATHVPLAVVATSAKTCLGCRDVGYAVRQLRLSWFSVNWSVGEWI